MKLLLTSAGVANQKIVGALAELVKNITEPVYAIDDQSAVVVSGNKIGVVSEGEWKKF